MFVEARTVKFNNTFNIKFAALSIILRLSKKFERKTMKKLILLLSIVFILNKVYAQKEQVVERAEIMTLGVFHFAYPNLDVVKTKDEDKISVLEEPYQSQIVAIVKAIEEYKPTIIAIEVDPDKQNKIDSLYNLFISGQFELKKGEEYQLGFRVAKNRNISKIYCVNDWGRYYKSIEELFEDSSRLAKFEKYYYANLNESTEADKVKNIVDELYNLNDPGAIKKRLSEYLDVPFKYEEKEGDFIGVDFETSRWFSRNLRIYRNIQRIPVGSEDKILLIMGREHLNLLNWFFDVSEEFELVSPLPYLEKAKQNLK